MQSITIELQIANRKYPLRLNESEAEIAREAADRLNEALSRLEKQYEVKDLQDLIAMAALQVSTTLIKGERDNRQESLDLAEKLTQLEHQMDAFSSP